MKITVIGGGSTYTPELVSGFLRRSGSLPLTELWLMDIDAGRLATVGGFAQRMVEAAGSPFRVVLSGDRAAALEGASYVVSPCLNEETIRLCNRYRVPCLPGAMTIREVVMCLEAGAEVVKLFPGELFGPAFITAIKGPLPQAKIMPTGGVSLENAAEWIKAVAFALGVGGKLTAGAKTGDYASVTKTARDFVDAIAAARGNANSATRGKGA